MWVRTENYGLYIIAGCALSEETNSLSSNSQVILVGQSTESLIEQLLSDRLEMKRQREKLIQEVADFTSLF